MPPTCTGIDAMGIANIPETMNGTTIGPSGGGGQKAGAAGQKRPQRRGKPQPDRPQRALFCLGVKNPIRALCIRIVEWKYPFCVNSSQRCHKGIKEQRTESILLDCQVVLCATPWKNEFLQQTTIKL